MGSGGGKGGGGSSGSVSIEPSPYQQTLANISNELYSTTKPVRTAFLEDWMSFLRPPGYSGTSVANTGITSTSPTTGATSNLWRDPTTGQTYSDPTLGVLDISGQPMGLRKGSWLAPYEQIGSISSQNAPAVGTTGGTNLSSSHQYDPYNLPGYAPIYDLSRTGLEEQYNVAKQNVMGGMARGGSLQNALQQLEQSRAESVGSLPAQISTNLIQDIMNKAYGAAWNAPSQSISGLASAAGSYSNLQAAQLQAQAQANAQATAGKSSGLGMLGTGLGYLGGSYLGGASWT